MRSIHNPLKLLIVTMLVCSALIFLHYMVGNSIVFAKQVRLSTHSPPSRTIVSISTFGKRVFHMGPCLDGIFSQTQKPDRIIISIPKQLLRHKESTMCPTWDIHCHSDMTHYDESQESILTWLWNYTGADFVQNKTHPSIFEFPQRQMTVQFLDKDWGPATKVLGALLLEHDPSTVIVTFDDDMVYNTDTVRWLATHMKQGVALSFGCEMWDTFRISFEGFSLYSYNNYFATTPRVCRGWLCGWTAVAYHIGDFKEDVWTFLDTLPHGCFYNDDMWLSAYVAKKGVVKVYAPAVLEHVGHRRDKELSLSTIMGSRERYGFPCARALFND